LTVIQFRPAYDIIAYFALAGQPYANSVIQNVDYPSLQVCPQLPCVKHNDSFVPYPLVFEYISKNFVSLDVGLSTRNLCELRAFTSLITVELAKVLDVARYDDDEHWWKVTYHQLKGALPWPFNRLVARKIRFEKLLSLEGLPGRQGERLKSWAIPVCKSAYKSLSERLGNGNWILNTFGPTSLDALLFGHIAAAKFEPGLSDVLAEYPNLDLFFEKVLDRINKVKYSTVGHCTFPGPYLLTTKLEKIPFGGLRTEKKKPADPNSELDPLRLRIAMEAQREGLLFVVGLVVAYLGWSQLVVIEEDIE